MSLRSLADERPASATEQEEGRLHQPARSTRIAIRLSYIVEKMLQKLKAEGVGHTVPIADLQLKPSRV